MEKNCQFECFYREQYPFAYGYLMRIVRDADDAYDILTHSFELALARFDEYLAAQQPRYWFFGIVRNTASYFLRKRAKEFRQSLPLPRATPTPEELALAGEEAQMIDAVIVALPEKYRDVVLLRFQDFTYAEIASSLDLTVEAVESRMRRAIVKLEPVYARYKENNP